MNDRLKKINGRMQELKDQLSEISSTLNGYSEDIKDMAEDLANDNADDEKDDEEPIQRHEKDWHPNPGQKYWFIDDMGKTDFEFWDYSEHVDEVDRFRLMNNNVFETEEIAERKLELDKAIAKRRYYPTDSDNFVYTIKYDTDTHRLASPVCQSFYFNGLGVVYFDEQFKAQYIINHYGEELKEFYF